MRIGVFICHCGSNIEGTVDTATVAKTALEFPEVVYATDTMACKTVENTCFCHWVGGGPSDPAGSDVLCTPVDGGYLVEAVSDKGAPLLANPLLEDGEAKVAEADAVKAAARAALGDAPDIANAPEALLAVFDDADFWRDMGTFKIGGVARQFEMVASPIHNPDSPESRILIFKHDVTLEKQYEAKYYKAEKMASIGMCPECRYPLCGFGKS